IFKSLLISESFNLPMPFLSGFLMNIKGRKVSMGVSYAFSALFTMLVIVDTPNVSIYTGLMKNCLTNAYNTLRIYAAEAYPTKLRANSYGALSCVGKVANVGGPFVSE